MLIVRKSVGVIAFATLASAAWCDETYVPHAAGPTATVCIDRMGDNGRLNIAAATVAVGDYAAVVLRGEMAACVYVPPGEMTISASSPDPYGATDAPLNCTKCDDQRAAWKSNQVKVIAASGKLIRIYVCGDHTQGQPSWRVVGESDRAKCEVH